MISFECPSGNNIISSTMSVFSLVTMLTLSTFNIAVQSLSTPAMTVLRKSISTSASTTKQLFLLRHGQATHNPRAEAAKDAGCSYDEFFELMRQDDSLDSELTALGRQQASRVGEKFGNRLFAATDLIVSSPLSRALQTAEGATATFTNHSNRLMMEEFREIHGVLLNAKRRTRNELEERFPRWDTSRLATDHDNLWVEEVLEASQDAVQRSVMGLQYLFQERLETNILLVAHGGLLHYTLQDGVTVRDGRKKIKDDDTGVNRRFENCGLRRYEMTEDSGKIVLTELDLLEEE